MKRSLLKSAVAPVLAEFVETQALAGTGIGAEQFWCDFALLYARFTPMRYPAAGAARSTTTPRGARKSSLAQTPFSIRPCPWRNRHMLR